MKRSYFFHILLFCVTILQAQNGDGFQMPMKITPVVSGSFGELRANHFHSGIDLTTVGRIGVPVYASWPGFVSRIKISSGGYGKALYVEHPNGLTSVYAHLNGYSPRIDSVVRARQYADESFEIEIHPKPNEINIAGGELVAYSGNTGSSGGPHLHFELRHTELQDPIDPMPYMPSIKDDVKPSVYGVKLYPLSPVSKVGNGSVAVYLPVVPAGDVYKLKENQFVSVAGKIGVGVHVTDFLSNNKRNCGVSDIKLFCDGKLMFQSNVGHISFAETRYINSFIDYSDRIRNNRFIQKSFVDDNNRSSVYQKKDELEILPGQQKQMRYEIRDISGNLSVIEFVLKGVEPFGEPKRQPLRMGEFRVGWRRGIAVDTAGLSVFIPAESLYRDEVIKVGVSRSTSYANPLYQVGSDDIAIHAPFELSIPIPETELSNPTKCYIAHIDSKNRVNYMGGSILNDRLILKSRIFGRFTVLTDKEAPMVVIKKVADNNHRTQPFINITIKDEKSGIAFYRCEIDGKWQLFEYDYKTASLKGDLRRMNLEKGRKHQLVVTVKDARGNEKTENYLFLY